MKIGNVMINGYTALAPMAGVADHAFRTVCKEFGAAYLVGEMASAKGICMSDQKSEELLSVAVQERPMAVQLFGNDPETMAQAAMRAMDFKPDIIDINMGCPTPKIVSNGAGSALMKTPQLAGRVIESVARAVPIPVTVKIRKGWDSNLVNAAELARTAELSGASAITVHGRTREQMYSPPVDLDIIAEIKASVRIPVIGNGDISSPEDAKRMLQYTHCDLVMIGRGALGRPWVFRQIEDALAGRKSPDDPSLEQRMKIMLEHIRLLVESKGEHIGMLEARKHAAWYMHGLRGASALRGSCSAFSRYEDAERLAEMVLSQCADS